MKSRISVSDIVVIYLRTLCVSNIRCDTHLYDMASLYVVTAMYVLSTSSVVVFRSPFRAKRGRTCCTYVPIICLIRSLTGIKVFLSTQDSFCSSIIYENTNTKCIRGP